jgi:glucosamine-6-phosphate deaminase
MRVIILKDYEIMSDEAAKIVERAIHTSKRMKFVLGLATGNTPIGLYERLGMMYREGYLDFRHVITFNLDEYIGIPKTNPNSYYTFMHQHLFGHINIDASNIHIPNGMLGEIDKNLEVYEAFCESYEREIEESGGIDLQVLGLGRNGHIGFNEPGSSLGSKTRVKPLSDETRKVNSWMEDFQKMPTHSITMGIRTILEARQVLLMTSGKGKADAARMCIEGPLTAMVPGSMLQMHQNAIILLDEDAAAKLTNLNQYEKR